MSWTLWHFALAMVLFLIVFRWSCKQTSLYFTMSFAFAFELYQYFFEIENYVSTKEFFKNSLYDLWAALMACIFLVIILREAKQWKEKVIK